MARAEEQPVVLVLAGPNGAGKSTAAPLLIDEMAGIDRYVNADAIARGFSPFEPDLSAVTAGRVMLQHIEHLARNRQNFALETTLSGVRLAARLEAMKATGYEIHLIYLWLPTVDLAVKRVERRVNLGGHAIEKGVIRRRFLRSLRNLTEIYQPIADSWYIYDNAEMTPIQIARGGIAQEPMILERLKWESIRQHREFGVDHEQ